MIGYFQRFFDRILYDRIFFWSDILSMIGHFVFDPFFLPSQESRRFIKLIMSLSINSVSKKFPNIFLSRSEFPDTLRKKSANRFFVMPVPKLRRKYPNSGTLRKIPFSEIKRKIPSLHKLYTKLVFSIYSAKLSALV